MPTKLGQNFLKDVSIADKIIASADLQPDDFVIEIGPGKGVLTEKLAEKAGQVVAIEVDEVLSKLLSNSLSNKKNLEIINRDILKINLPELLAKYKISEGKYKVIANLPYYITSPIIRLFLETEIPPGEMILMVQKEVAERITAKAGEMSILAVSVQYYAQAEILFEVSRNCFEPAPEVDSAVIKISNLKSQVSKLENKNFFHIVRAGFCAKRKTLSNNLSNSLHLDKKEVEEKLESLGIEKTARAQELEVEDWKKIAQIFN